MSPLASVMVFCSGSYFSTVILSLTNDITQGNIGNFRKGPPSDAGEEATKAGGDPVLAFVAFISR